MRKFKLSIGETIYVEMNRNRNWNCNENWNWNRNTHKYKRVINVIIRMTVNVHAYVSNVRAREYDEYGFYDIW